MAGPVNDTSTTLNPGSGGDTMDESLVTQVGGTVAKRPRVVIGGDDGSIQNFRELASGTSALVSDLETIRLLGSILLQLQVMTGVLKLAFNSDAEDNEALAEVGDAGG